MCLPIVEADFSISALLVPLFSVASELTQKLVAGKEYYFFYGKCENSDVKSCF